MTVNEAAVNRIIAETLRRHGNEDTADPDVWEAQHELYDRRIYDPALIGDRNYAIAELYMLSRALVATSQIPVQQILAPVRASDDGPCVGPASTPSKDAPDRERGASAALALNLALRKITEGARDGEAQRLRNNRPKPALNPKALTGYPAFRKLLALSAAPPPTEIETTARPPSASH